MKKIDKYKFVVGQLILFKRDKKVHIGHFKDCGCSCSDCKGWFNIKERIDGRGSYVETSEVITFREFFEK